MDERAVVTCFLRHGPEVLLLRRSEAADDDPGRWGVVSGSAAGTPDEAARREITEEVGPLDAVALVRAGDPIEVTDDEGTTRLLRPYLFDCASTDVAPSAAVAAHEWVQPPAVLERETVPSLWAAYDAVAPTVETVRDDADHGSAYVSLRALEVLRDRAAATAAGRDRTDLRSLARDLRAARPSMAAVDNRVNRLLSESDGSPPSVRDAAVAACERAVAADGEAAERAAEVVGDRVLTLSRSGTVLEALLAAAPETVVVAESRPAKEGVGVAAELADDAIDVSLCVDAAVGHVLATTAVDCVVVGADSVLADGAVVNKVGTRLAALAAREAGVDCYAVCSRDKVFSRASVPLESGPPDEVYERNAAFEVRNPTFERTPPELFAGVVTEAGVLSPAEVQAAADEHAEMAEWDG